MKNFNLILKCLKLGMIKHFQFFKDFEIFYLEKNVHSNSKKERKPSKSTAKSDSEKEQTQSQIKERQVQILLKELHE